MATTPKKTAKKTTKKTAKAPAAKRPAASPVGQFLPDLVTLLEAGAHFGHERSKRNPKMEPYIYMQRERVAIIDLEQTRKALADAAAFAYETAKNPAATILFVGTKRQARSLVQTYAEAAGQPYVTKRWLGGTLTNFQTILKSVEKLDELKRMEGTAQFEKMTKKEKAVRNKEIERLEGVLEGLKDIKQLPTALFVAGTHDDQIALREAARVGIPVIGITDTNADPTRIEYPIPANDDAIRSLHLIVGVITRAIMTARGKSLDTLPNVASFAPKQQIQPEEQTAAA